MKVNFDSANYNKKVNNNLAFKGYKPTKTDEGNRTGEFSYPFDPAQTDCYLEVALVERDRFGNYYLTGDKYTDILNDTEEGRKLYPGKNRINIHAEFGIMEDEPFAYHYKLVNKKTGEVERFGVDAGALLDSREDKTSLTDENLYNLYVPASDVSRGGSMLLLVPDSFDPKWVYDADNDIIRNENYDELRYNIRLFSNKMGGSLAGLEKRLEQGAMDPYDRIVSLPLFTDDSRTHHAYWNKNCMQMALSLGNINNYTSLTKALFAKGKTLVSDGAFVNEGLEGIHFNHAIKWKEQSPFFDWFRMNPDDQILFGVFSQNTDFLSHRLVNPKFFYKKAIDGSYVPVKNPEYKPTKPTYLEIFDKDLVKSEKLDPQEPIDAYNKNFYDKPLSKTTHNDTVIPYRFPIDVREYDLNVKQLNEYNKEASVKIDLYSGMGTKFISQFSNMQLDNKIEGNLDTWNSNFDIAKIHYFLSNADTERLLSIKPGHDQQEEAKKLQYAANEARDYVVTSARYWTRKTNQILNLYVAQNLKGLDEEDPKEVYKTIIKKVNSGVFPQRLKNNLSEEAVKNIMEGHYDGLKGNTNTNDFKTQVAQYMMNMPLDSIEFGDDISAVLATPYITKRSYKEDYIGQPEFYQPDLDDTVTYDRFFLNKIGNPHLQPKYEKVYRETNHLFIGDTPYSTGPLTDFAVDIIDRLNNDKERPANEKIHIGDDNTEYGNYVLPYLAEEILKYAVIKSLCEAPRFQTNDNGDISYDYNRLKKITLKDIGVQGINPEDEAHQLIKRIKSGLDDISESDREALADALKKKLKKTTAQSFRLAEAIVDRSQAGLDWRIDAAKDVADVESLREEGETDFDTIFEQVTSFWEKFAHDVLKENPNSYMVAELTDMNELYDEYGHGSKRYPNKTNLIGKFLTDSNLTSVANYDFFFSTLPEMFSKDFNVGQHSSNGGSYLEKKLHFQLVDPETGFLRSAPLQSLMFSYTFLNNHDNTRALHAMALDMDFFHGIKNYWTNHDHREEAVQLITGEYDSVPSDIDSYHLERYSPMDLAMISALKKGFMGEIDDMVKTGIIGNDRADSIRDAIRMSLTEIANNKYCGQSFESGSFGVKPIDMTIDLTIENAKNAGFEFTEKELNMLSENVFERIMKPAYQKYNAMMEFLVALPGNPTLYSGDELGSTGYEYETKNVTLQNRSYLHNEWVDKHSPDRRKFVVENNNTLKKIMYQRKRPELQALNDGAIFALKLQKGSYGVNNEEVEIPTILRENTAGHMTISLLNVSGLEKIHEPTAEHVPNKVTLNQIDLSADERKRHILTVGLPAGLPLNTVFFDSSREDNSDMKHIYVVEKNDKNQYCIKHRIKDTDGKYKEAPIEITGNTMILYHDPKRKIENLSFKGRKFLYNPQFKNFGTMQNNPYIAKKEAQCGEKLSLVSR